MQDDKFGPGSYGHFSPPPAGVAQRPHHFALHNGDKASLPFPALEIKLSKRSVVNITGSPAVDFADQKNNAVLFFQYKLQLL